MKKVTVQQIKNQQLPYVGIPVADRTVIAMQDKAEEKTAGGIIIPEGTRRRPQRATVLGVSVDCKKVKVGDTVLYGEHAGVERLINGITCISLKENDILIKNP